MQPGKREAAQQAQDQALVVLHQLLEEGSRVVAMGWGRSLVAAPAKIADGIFLIALNNLEDAKTRNVSLMTTRDWIDIPVQYKTGRRALVTLEKGASGAAVFKEVFDAWNGDNGSQ